MKWLNSLDELLYEVMSWLLFFPLTLLRAISRPFHVMKEVEREATLPEEQQYAAVISPPLFLALGLLLAHAVASALGETDAIVANRHGLAALVDDNTSALVLRVIIFASFALFLAARLTRASGVKVDRQSLRLPFYEQCYPTAVFALGLSLGASLVVVPHRAVHAAGVALIVASLLNFVVLEVCWFARTLGWGFLRATGSVLIALLQGLTFLLLVGFLFTR